MRSRLIQVAVMVAALAAATDARGADMISVSAGATRDANVYFMDAVVEFDAPPVAMRSVLFKMCDFKDVLHHVAYCRTFAVEGSTAWSYMVLDVPVFEPRDYTLASTIDEDLQPDGSGTFRSHWVADNSRGPAEREGVTRLNVNQGSWTMKAIDGGKRTWLHYTVRVHPGGNIPGWVAGYVSRKTLPDYMRMLERLGQREARDNPRPLGEPTVGAPARPLDTPLPPVERRYGPRLAAWLP